MSAYTPDLIITALILFSGFYGLARGFIDELLQLLLWVISFVIAWYVSPLMGPWLQEIFIIKTFSSSIAFVVLFIASIFLLGLGTSALQRTMTPRAGLINRIIGFFFGILRGFILISALILLYLMVSRQKSDDALVQGSFLYDSCGAIAKYVHVFLGEPNLWSYLASFLPSFLQ